jgi:hypothetical protein
MITRIEYLLDWLLFALGHPHFGELPPEPVSCEGCSIVLYQLFNLFPVMYLPKDYWGSVIADAKSKGSQRHTGYFPTPNTVANAIGQMLFSPEQDTRLQVGCEPTVGTGVMTLEPSNRILSMVATDVDKVLLKATLVNWYLYCPWFAMPPFYLIDRTDLMWGNSLAEPDRENAPVSIHQKYWIKQYRDIYPVNLVEKDWREEIQKIIDLQPAPVAAPKIQQPKIEDDLMQANKSSMPKGFKRAMSKKNSKSLF